MEKDKFVVIQSWMLDYQLNTKELLIYAIINGFSQDSESYFYGSRQYLADWSKTSVRQVQRILDDLVKKNFLKKTFRIENNVKQCFYQALKPRDTMARVETLCPRGEDTMTLGEGHYGTAPSDTMAHNNKYITNIKERENKEACAFDTLTTNKDYVNQLYEKWTKYNFLNRGQIEFFNRFNQIHTYLKGITSEDVFSAIDNYKKVKDSNGWYAQKHNLTFESFCKNINGFLPGNFDLKNYCNSQQIEQIAQEEEKEKNIIYYICPNCKQNKTTWIFDKQKFICKNCKNENTLDEVLKQEAI